MSADRSGVGRPRILISGTGRSGTTLLVQYFTALGFDTGFTLEQAVSSVDSISLGGLETPLDREPLPYVAKSPFYTTSLGRRLDAGDLDVQCCIVPVRDLYAAAQSRREVSRKAEAAGLDPAKHRGGLAFRAQRHPARQEARLAEQFYRLIHTLVQHAVPVHFLSFPTFARDPDELYRALEPLLDAHDVSAAESQAALSKVVRPTAITDYEQ